uniref:Ovule protein n=1 Tax=Taenia asiatica TaxID=60517 RepID=A0A0R3VUS1_TAEAS
MPLSFVHKYKNTQRHKEGYIHTDCNTTVGACVRIPLYQDALPLPHCITYPSYDEKLFYSTCVTFDFLRGQGSSRQISYSIKFWI